MWEFMVLIKKISHVVEDKLECKTRNKNIMIMEVNLSAGLQMHSVALLYLRSMRLKITCRNTMCFDLVLGCIVAAKRSK